MSSSLLTLLRRRPVTETGDFSPEQLPNLALWLSAQVPETLTFEDDGEGGAVSEWADARGNGKVAVQSSGTLQPYYSPTDLGGEHPGVTFDGADDYLIVEGVGGGYAPEVFAVLLVVTPHSSSGVGVTCLEGPDNNAKGYMAYATYNTMDTPTQRVDTINAFGGVLVRVTVAGGKVACIGNYLARDVGANAALLYAAKGTAGDIEEVPYTFASSDIQGTLTGFDYINIGRYPAGAHYLHHTLSEFLVFDGPITPEQRVQLVAWARSCYTTAFEL